MSDVLSHDGQEYKLNRFPLVKKDKLRAWDAADEYMLQYLQEKELTNKNILVVNDSFGALSTVLCDQNKVTVWSDSYLSEQGLKENLKLNNKLPDNVGFVPSTETPSGCFDVVLIKIPKIHSLLDDYLKRLYPVISEKTIFLAAAMAKNIHTNTLKIFEKNIGETKTSLAKKKARLVFVKKDKNIEQKNNNLPARFEYEVEGLKIKNHSGVFSREGLDIGARFLLENIPISPEYKNIIDLGCGNGIVGMMAAFKNPQSKIIFTDESYMAVASAQENMRLNHCENKAEYLVADCMGDMRNNGADLILNNPPFHQQHAVGDEVAWRMFTRSKKVLKKGAELIVIGNRHLAYHIKLKKIFGNCELVATNKKFVILKAVK